MNPGKTLHSSSVDEEVAALIETLHLTGQRLEELTAGEVDAVADREGRTFVLQHAQEQLRHFEDAKQAAILNALPAHIALLDGRGGIVSVNDAWKQFSCADAVLGPGHAVGINYPEICAGAVGHGSRDAHQIASGIRSVLDSEASSFSFEFPCDLPTGQRWFLMTATPLSHDRPNGAVVMLVDVSAERQAVEGLRASESRFQQMADAIRDVFFLIDADSNCVLYVSPVYEEIWGRSRESLYANPESWTESIHPDDQASTYEKYKSGMATGKFEYSYRIVRPDGLIRLMEVRGFPVRDPSGKVVRIAGIVVDITDNERAARQLRESERRFSDMLSNIELVSLMLDSRAHITYCNDYLLRLTGWSREEVIGQDWFALFIPPEDVALRTVNRRLLADDPGSKHHDNEIVTRSGEHRMIRWNNSVLRSAAGDVIGTASIGEDITERRMAEEVLTKRAAELERFHRLSVGREMQMIELKKRLNELAAQAGQALPYDLGFLKRALQTENDARESST